MAVSHIHFDPKGAPLRVHIDYKGLVAASYTYTLWEADSNDIVVQKHGNNQNPQDDTYTLPLPVHKNAQRLLDIHSSLLGLYDHPNEGDYQVIISVFQGEVLIARHLQPQLPKPIGQQSAAHQFYALLEPNNLIS
jgi:hypothetical protein